MASNFSVTHSSSDVAFTGGGGGVCIPNVQTLTSISLSDPAESNDRLPILNDQSADDLERLLFEPRPGRSSTTATSASSARSRVDSMVKFAQGMSCDLRYFCFENTTPFSFSSNSCTVMSCDEVSSYYES